MVVIVLVIRSGLKWARKPYYTLLRETTEIRYENIKAAEKLLQELGLIILRNQS